MIKNGRFQPVQRREDSRFCLSAPGWRQGQQSRMLLDKVQDDRAGFEQRYLVVFIGRDLAKRLQRKMGGLLHLSECQQPDLLGLADLLKGSADTHVLCKTKALIGGVGKGGDHLRSSLGASGRRGDIALMP